LLANHTGKFFMKLRSKFVLCTAISLSLLGASADAATWGTYHWARKANPMKLKVIDSVTPEWNSALTGTLQEWGYSPMLDFVLAAGDETAASRQACNLVQGQIRVCNYAYGATGWLGLASIGVDANGHIDKGRAKLNDSYTSYWALAGERNHVMCQEVGHVFGLGHTSEDGSSQGTCMDYSTNILSQWPNAGDYDSLLKIYGGHVDSYNSYYVTTTTTSTGGTTTTPTTDPAPTTCTARGKNKCSTASKNMDAPMGVKIGSNGKKEMWVARRSDGGIWIHILYLAHPDHNHLDDGGHTH
jgi:hypothetical protein